MIAALAWGALAASSLVLGAALAFARRWSQRQVGLVLAFGAGALISAVSFELAQEGLAIGGAGATGLGLGVGALTYFGLDGAIAKRNSAGRGRRGRGGDSDGGTALALGAFLDGIPEQLVLGISLAASGEIGVALLVAIFVSNLPEALGSAEQMHEAGTSRATILRLWLLVAAICVLATALGYLVAEAVGGGCESRDRRLRRRSAAGDADRLDDSRRPRRGRPRGRPRHRPRLRPRRRALQPRLDR